MESCFGLEACEALKALALAQTQGYLERVARVLSVRQVSFRDTLVSSTERPAAQAVQLSRVCWCGGPALAAWVLAPLSGAQSGSPRPSIKTWHPCHASPRAHHAFFNVLFLVYSM